MVIINNRHIIWETRNDRKHVHHTQIILSTLLLNFEDILLSLVLEVFRIDVCAEGEWSESRVERFGISSFGFGGVEHAWALVLGSEFHLLVSF